MGFFEDLREKASDLAQTGVAKAKQVAEIVQLRAANAGEENAMKKAYLQLGQLYYEKLGQEPGEDFAELCEKITASRALIETNNERIAQLRADSGLNDAAEKAADVAGNVKDAAFDAAEKAKDVASDVIDRVKDSVDQKIEKISDDEPEEAAEQVRETLEETAEEVQESFEESLEQVQETLGDAAEKIVEIRDTAAEKLEDVQKDITELIQSGTEPVDEEVAEDVRKDADLW